MINDNGTTFPELIQKSTSLLGKSKYHFASGAAYDALKEADKLVSEYDASDKEKYKAWIRWWRATYKQLSASIRTLKRMRSPSYISSIYPDMSEGDAYSISAKSHTMLAAYRVTARTMMAYRMDAKAARKRHFEESSRVPA